MQDLNRKLIAAGALKKPEMPLPALTQYFLHNFNQIYRNNQIADAKMQIEDSIHPKIPRLPVPEEKPKMLNLGKSLSCRVCGKDFQNEHRLKQHEKLHTKRSGKTHPCNICGKFFSTPGYLETHMRLHTGAKPYRCGICGKGYHQRPGYTYHMRTHAGPESKKFECKVCGKKFIQIGTIKRHCETHDIPPEGIDSMIIRNDHLSITIPKPLNRVKPQRPKKIEGEKISQIKISSPEPVVGAPKTSSTPSLDTSILQTPPRSDILGSLQTSPISTVSPISFPPTLFPNPLPTGFPRFPLPSYPHLPIQSRLPNPILPDSIISPPRLMMPNVGASPVPLSLLRYHQSAILSLMGQRPEENPYLCK